MASVNVILGLIIVLGIIYMYINSRQYLVREGFYSASNRTAVANMKNGIYQK